MKIKAKKRKIVGKKTKILRQEGKLPASIYGPKQDPMNIEVDAKEFRRVFLDVGTNKFVDLVIDEKDNVKVLIKEVQMEPLTGKYIHVSFYAIDETKSIIADVPVEIIGESPAVKTNIGFLVIPFDHLTLRCLPKDLPENIPVEISNLKEIGDSVLISDIEFPEGVEIAGNIDETASLAYIAPPQKEIVEEEVKEEEEEGEEEGEKEAEGGEEKKEEKPSDEENTEAGEN